MMTKMLTTLNPFSHYPFVPHQLTTLKVKTPSYWLWRGERTSSFFCCCCLYSQHIKCRGNSTKLPSSSLPLTKASHQQYHMLVRLLCGKRGRKVCMKNKTLKLFVIIKKRTYKIV